MEETSLCRGDDGPAFRLALSFHGPQRRVPSVRQAIDVLVDFLVYDSARHATTARRASCSGMNLRRPVDKPLSRMSGHRTAGWDMCKLTKPDSTVLSLYLEPHDVNDLIAR